MSGIQWDMSALPVTSYPSAAKGHTSLCSVSAFPFTPSRSIVRFKLVISSGDGSKKQCMSIVGMHSGTIVWEYLFLIMHP